MLCSSVTSSTLSSFDAFADINNDLLSPFKTITHSKQYMRRRKAQYRGSYPIEISSDAAVVQQPLASQQRSAPSLLVAICSPHEHLSMRSSSLQVQLNTTGGGLKHGLEAFPLRRQRAGRRCPLRSLSHSRWPFER